MAEDHLPSDARELIAAAQGAYVSAASVWEIEIKRRVGRLHAPDDIDSCVDAAGYERLAISFEHAIEAARLPTHLGDPFDRMLVAQARLEGLTLATADARMAQYGVAVLEVARA